MASHGRSRTIKLANFKPMTFACYDNLRHASERRDRNTMVLSNLPSVAIGGERSKESWIG